MQIVPFELERWQSVWEHHVELNISESGVEPLSAGELLDDPAARERLLSLPLGYPQTNGSEELRGRIAELYPGASAANVLLTCGCSEANYVAVWSLVEPGDEVIFMQPNYMQIAGVAQSFGAEVKPLWLREDLRWAPDIAELRRLLSPKTRLIAVCNPSNPTGAVLRETLMDEICAAAASVGAWILADEVYRGAEFSGALTPAFYGRYDRVLCTGGFSKAFGMPGLRTGWVVGPESMAEKLWGYHDYTTIGPTMITDRLAALALEPARRARILDRTRRIVRENYGIVRAWAERHAGLLTHIPPAAGAIGWFGYKGKGTTAELAEAARRQKNLLIVPGEQLGMAGYLRIGFGGHADKLQEALGRLDELFVELQEKTSATRA
ncbi:MAG: aminotransferase class I/II-fold pyridoxal phosphate-dependent enzyme [Acidobacteria bacterium]|nr:aminotransferase class I/II-fold pyridoxal phosphate-dependent enzyme [Acidobacteriota bacterium]MBI3662453.1 aminotransferase class I/II-fold pyridoxal phosphate-dependent enzyme [Acidobacteriota bacterium]